MTVGSEYKGRKVVILGLGRQGMSMARFFARAGAQVVISDRRTEDALRERAPQRALVVYISEKRWRGIDPQLRQRLSAVLRRSEIVGRYVANVASDLRARGEDGLASDLIEAVALQLTEPL